MIDRPDQAEQIAAFSSLERTRCQPAAAYLVDSIFNLSQMFFVTLIVSDLTRGGLLELLLKRRRRRHA